MEKVQGNDMAKARMWLLRKNLANTISHRTNCGRLSVSSDRFLAWKHCHTALLLYAWSTWGSRGHL